jgi:type VI protein secretion system component VasA
MPNIAVIKERQAKAAWRKVSQLASKYLRLVEQRKETREAVIAAVLAASEADAACSRNPSKPSRQWHRGKVF